MTDGARARRRCRSATRCSRRASTRARRAAPAWRIAAPSALRAVYVVAALAVFVFALQLLKAGAGGLKPILERASTPTARANIVGFGWLGSYIVLSGSPVAAIALSLFSGACSPTPRPSR